MSNIRGVHVLAEFPCPKCGGPSVAMAVAQWSGNRLIDPTEHAGGRTECVACKKAEHDAANKAWRDGQARKKWKPKLAGGKP